MYEKVISLPLCHAKANVKMDKDLTDTQFRREGRMRVISPLSFTPPYTDNHVSATSHRGRRLSLPSEQEPGWVMQRSGAISGDKIEIVQPLSNYLLRCP
jgi:hypothetical protein